MEFWTPQRRAEQKSMKQQDEDRYTRIQKRLFSDDIGIKAMALFRENSDNPACCRTCLTCKKVCKTTTQMFRHEGTEECKKRQCKNEGTEFVPPAPPRCDVCSKDFKNKYCLIRHLTTAAHKRQVSFLKNGPEIFRCEKCDQTFTTKKGLKKHLASKKHQQTEPDSFHCSVCDKSFANKKCLKQHQTRKSHRIQVALANIVSMSRKR